MHCQLLRNEWLDLTTIIPTTDCHQRNYVEAYSRYTTKPGGTGLGLYIVQEVMTAHGGQVAVQSTVGVGTTLTLTLPLAAAEEVT